MMNITNEEETISLPDLLSALVALLFQYKDKIIIFRKKSSSKHYSWNLFFNLVHSFFFFLFFFFSKNNTGFHSLAHAGLEIM